MAIIPQRALTQFVSATKSAHLLFRWLRRRISALARWLSNAPLVSTLIGFIQKIDQWIASRMPKGLYARALIIIIAPIVLLQTVVTFVFMERHWDTVTKRLSEATTRDIAMLIEIYENNPTKEQGEWIAKLAQDKLKLTVQILPPDDLPPARPKPFFSILDRALASGIRQKIGKPFWIDTVGRSNHVEIRIRLEDAIFRAIARRSQTYASNSHIFLVWMIVTSLILITIAILFMRNQIRPILRLADAAETFGKGRQLPDDFRPRGAREVRQAAAAFIEMRDRIERHVEQRTTMLAGVSHDLRTILTRFKLQLAMLGDSDDIQGLLKDTNEMQQMLEDYMSFAKGDGGEEATIVSINEILEELDSEFDHHGKDITINEPVPAEIEMLLRRQAFKRAIGNLIGNAVRYADKIVISAVVEGDHLKISVDDDGPGIPDDMREEVFRPFFRADTARNQDQPNSGLGLSIALDIAHSHGGDITLLDSKLGGLKALVKIPI